MAGADCACEQAQGGLKGAEEANRRLDSLDAGAGSAPKGGGALGELEKRMAEAEAELQRLGGTMDVGVAMEDQAKQLAELFASKASKDDLASVRMQSDSGDSKLKAELEERAQTIAGLIAAQKEELQGELEEVGVVVEKKADREWLDEFESKIRDQMAKIASDAENGVSPGELDKRLAALRKMLESAMEGMNDSKGSGAFFRCLACDRPLPPQDNWKAKTRHGNASQSIRDGPPPPEDAHVAGRASPQLYPPVAGGGGEDTVVLRGGFPMSATFGSPGASPSSHIRTTGCATALFVARFCEVWFALRSRVLLPV